MNVISATRQLPAGQPVKPRFMHGAKDLLGRNTLLGPGFFNLDAGLSKDIRLGGTRRLQLRWEVFNLTNHPSFGLPNAELGSADFGTIRSTVSTPRQMQFGVKFLF